MLSGNLNEWFDGYPNLDGIKLEESEFEDIESIMEIGKEANFEKTHVSGLGVNGSEPDFDGFKPIVDGYAPVAGESGRTVKVEEDESKPEVELGFSIEESKPEDFYVFKPTVCGSEPVRGESGCTVEVEEEEFKPEGNPTLPIEEVIEKVSLDDGLESGSSSSESNSESSSSSSSSSSSDDDDDDETDEILSALDIELEEVDHDDEDAGASKGPIRSKNEAEVLPPVPPLDVELQPHHQMLSVGVILSMVGTKVIVEGRDRHNPLNEGSVLWITMNRSPLGFVDEIFGPVKNPYYIVRYNSESDVPAGIHEGISISFVTEFANHVLNDKNLHKKGYDASGENDEELSDDPEFSDDEKEAEYKRMQKMTKRSMNDQRVGNQKSNKKKVRSKNGAWKTNRNSAQQTSTTAMGQLPPNRGQHNISRVSGSLVNHNSSSSVVGQQNFVGGSGFIPPFSVMPSSSGIVAPSNGVWNNGMPGQHPQNTNFPNMFSAEGMSMLSQNHPQRPIPLPNPAISMPNMMLYQQQQFDPSLSTLPNMVVLPSGQSSLFARSVSAPWLEIAGQNGFNQSPFGTGMQAQQLLSALQGIITNGPTVDGNCNLQPNGVQGNFESSQNFNMGAPSSRGRKPYHRGRGRGRGGRGHRRS
ncbi:H/ACA ribonucleoprotein complex non-core subunit NAF1-like isoform X2 [Hibiscus syriacus]|uniref:H/ACA ribonucleoprotein complex non-core subunit NAF1-like isoform X2 n=1 Tax=Hibiscus syriacus TaxID=106335 RepID=UPI001920B88A|nr:H/ACA ribonucleoprotein complex non-core subunit NAF1-like isoform X2 [Hibiscus syriacus]